MSAAKDQRWSWESTPSRLAAGIFLNLDAARDRRGITAHQKALLDNLRREAEEFLRDTGDDNEGAP